MKLEKVCGTCSKIFLVPQWRPNAKFCCPACRQESLKGEKDSKCTQCGCMFHMKKSQQKRYTRRLGTFCSNTCLAEFKKVGYKGDENPNWKNKGTDSDGYLIWVKAGMTGVGIEENRLHRAVACESLGVIKIEKAIHVHHRDCNILNNTPQNLAVMNASEHKWLHKAFGNAALYALSVGKVSIDDLTSWCYDPLKAKQLLTRDLHSELPDSMHIIDGVLMLKSTGA